NVLAAQTVVVAGSGGWQANLNVAAVPGSFGRITAFATSPSDGSVVASASVNVTYGQLTQGGGTTTTLLQINVPQDEAVLNLNAPVTISGIGTGLFEGTVIVRVLDFEGNVLAEQPTTSPQGNWSLSLTLPAAPGTRGIIYAYSPSPLDGSPQVVDAVNVVFGPAQTGPFVTLSSPLPYALLDVETFKVSGRGGGLFEGNVIVRALDSAGNVLVEQPTTLNAAQVGGEGEWEALLTVEVDPGTRGVIEASSTSPADGSVIALARVPVTFGLPDPNMPFVHIVSPLPGSPLTAELGAAVRGYAGSLPTDTVTVQIIDAQGNILASRSAAVDAQSGLWLAPLTLAEVQAETSGRLVAFASGPNGTVVASDGFPIQFAE
ncbi:MAG: Gmad2 immunoglobulin-like domain-containing protein, partial [Anaerolineae bacterium]|nr:Gmad2 immunoglobulin-like domain-containing protein [Anaerolineae bacterium]